MQPREAAVKVVTSLLTPAPEKREEFLQTLRSLRARSSARPGAWLCVVCRDVDGGNHFVLISEWRDQAALMAHMDSDHFRILSGAVAPARRLGRVPLRHLRARLPPPRTSP